MKTKDTQLTESNMQWRKRHTWMHWPWIFLVCTRICWHLIMPNWNKLACGTLCTQFLKPWFMNNKQQVSPTEDSKYYFINSWTSYLMYIWFCNVYDIFLSFDTSRWPAIWHSKIGGINEIHPSDSNITSACNYSKTRNYGKYHHQFLHN